MFPQEQLREKVTIRVLPEKRQVYPRFKELVTKQIGSDVCFVTTSLWEAFIQAMDQTPPTNDKIEMKFLRQNVQINIGCSFTYQPKKARRTPASKGFPYFSRDKNYILPNLLDQWGNMTEHAKDFWRNEFIKQGIVTPPSISIGERAKAILKKIFKLWRSV